MSFFIEYNIYIYQIKLIFMVAYLFIILLIFVIITLKILIEVFFVQLLLSINGDQLDAARLNWF